MSDDKWTIWVCVCCYFAHHNGECCDRDDHGGDGVQPLSAIGTGYELFSGIGWRDHSDDCLTNTTNRLREDHPEEECPDVPDDYECECETYTFSKSQCDGCGSWLYGERHGMTMMKTVSVGKE